MANRCQDSRQGGWSRGSVPADGRCPVVSWPPRQETAPKDGCPRGASKWSQHPAALGNRGPQGFQEPGGPGLSVLGNFNRKDLVAYSFPPKLKVFLLLEPFALMFCAHISGLLDCLLSIIYDIALSLASLA